MKKRSISLPWWIFVLSVNSFFILASVINPYIYDFPGKGLIFTPLNLAFEMNLAVWWSTILLIFSGLIAYELFSTRTDKTKLAWLVLGIIFLSLSLDEIGSIHERVRSLLPYILLGGSFFTYSFSVLYKSPDTRRSALLILAGFTLFGVTAILEVLEHNMYWPEWSKGLRIGLEEGVELVGSFLLLLALILQRQGSSQKSLSLIFPSPFRMRHISELLFILLIVHVFISLITTQIEISHRGNPVVWYPTFLFLILFLEFFDQADKVKNGWIQPWRLASIFFLLSSISTVYIISPRISASMFHSLGLFSNFYFLFFLHLLTANALLFLIHRTISRMQLFVVVALALLLFLGYISGELAIQYVISGIYTYLIARLFLGSLAISGSQKLSVAEA